MKKILTALGAATYSTRCCYWGGVTASGAVTNPDYSIWCCSRAVFDPLWNAPRAYLRSITRGYAVSAVVLPHPLLGSKTQVTPFVRYLRTPRIPPPAGRLRRLAPPTLGPNDG